MSRDEAAFVMAQALSPTPPTSDKPADYEITQDGVMRALDTWKRDDRATYLRMMLEATNSVTRAEIALWTDEQVKQADCWAFSTYLSASGHDHMQVPERPSFIARANPYADCVISMEPTPEQTDLTRLMVGLTGIAVLSTLATGTILKAWGAL